MTSTGYTVLGWIVWQIGSRLAKRELADHRGKLGAVGAVALVLIGGAVAARAAARD